MALDNKQNPYPVSCILHISLPVKTNPLPIGNGCILTGERRKMAIVL